MAQEAFTTEDGLTITFVTTAEVIDDHDCRRVEISFQTPTGFHLDSLSKYQDDAVIEYSKPLVLDKDLLTCISIAPDTRREGVDPAREYKRLRSLGCTEEEATAIADTNVQTLKEWRELHREPSPGEGV